MSVWSLSSAVNACMHKHHWHFNVWTVGLLNIWRQSTETKLCVCICAGLLLLSVLWYVCMGSVHKLLLSLLKPSTSSSSVIFQVASWPPSHLQTLLTYLMRWLSASSRRQRRIFAQHYYQYQHTFILLQLNSSQMQTPRLIFSIADSSTCSIPFQLGSALFCSVAHKRAEA